MILVPGHSHTTRRRCSVARLQRGEVQPGRRIARLDTHSLPLEDEVAASLCHIRCGRVDGRRIRDVTMVAAHRSAHGGERGMRSLDGVRRQRPWSTSARCRASSGRRCCGIAAPRPRAQQWPERRRGGSYGDGEAQRQQGGNKHRTRSRCHGSPLRPLHTLRRPVSSARLGAERCTRHCISRQRQFVKPPRCRILSLLGYARPSRRGGAANA